MPTACMTLILALLAGGLAGCGGQSEDAPRANPDGGPETVPATNRTSQEVYDDFRSAADAAVQASGAPEAWATENGSPWAVVRELPVVAVPCPSVEYRDGPWQLKQLLLSPATDDPQGDRDRMRRHFEDRGMTVISAFDPQPHESPYAEWTVTARGQNGSLIDFSANSTTQGLVVYSECSSHPSMKEEIFPASR